MSIDKIDKIAKKFERSIEERLKNLELCGPIIAKVIGQLEKHIMDLYDNGIKFHIFDINIENNVIHVGLFECCQNKKTEISNAIYDTMEKNIINNTQFKTVVWESKE